MEVILLERIERLGQMGDVVSVKPGFARNFLLPRKKALRATEANLAFFETQKAQLETENIKRRDEAEGVSTKMEGASIVVIRQASEFGHLYGSVASRDVAEGLTEAGYSANKNQVQIERPIKEIGLYELRVVLHPEVSVGVTVNVARSEEEAVTQAEKAEAEARAEAAAEAAPEFEAPAEAEEAESTEAGDEQPALEDAASNEEAAADETDSDGTDEPKEA